MKNPKSRAQKSTAKASRTGTKIAALKDNRKSDDKITLLTSKLKAHQIPNLKLKLVESEVFVIPDSILNLDVTELTAEQIMILVADMSASSKQQEDALVVQNDAAATGSPFTK